MSNNNTLADNLMNCINDFIDRLCEFFAADDNDEYEVIAPDNSKIDIEIHLTIKARKK